MRRHYRRLRRNLSTASQRQNARLVLKHLLASGLFWRKGRIAAYAAARGELDTAPILQHGWQQGRSMALPAVVWSARSRRGELNFYRVEATDQLEHAAFGLPAPAAGSEHFALRSLAVLLVPLVAFDRSGMRLGQGGGYYDRLFALPGHRTSMTTPDATQIEDDTAAPPHAETPLRIGLAHACQRTDEPLPREPWDQALDAVVTEAGIAAFSPRGRRLLYRARRLSD